MDLIKIAAPVISHPATVYTIVLLLFVWAFLSGIILATFDAVRLIR